MTKTESLIFMVLVVLIVAWAVLGPGGWLSGVIGALVASRSEPDPSSPGDDAASERLRSRRTPSRPPRDPFMARSPASHCDFGCTSVPTHLRPTHSRPFRRLS